METSFNGDSGKCFQTGMIEVHVRVLAHCGPGDIVGITGDCPSLGNWLPSHSQILHFVRDAGEGISLWGGNINLPISSQISFRYFVGKLPGGRTQPHHGDTNDVIVMRWETLKRPRQFSTLDLDSFSIEWPLHDFGEYAGIKKVGRGWLTCQTELQLRLHSNPIHWWKSSHADRMYSIFCRAIDLRYKDSTMDDGTEEEEEVVGDFYDNEDSRMAHPSPTHLPIKVAMLNEEGVIKEQTKESTIYDSASQYLVFTINTLEPDFCAAKLEFYVHDNPTFDPRARRLVGYAYLLPINIADKAGVKVVPITGTKNQPIGQIAIDYLVVKPMSAYDCKMDVSYCRHWKKRDTLQIGHRGMGNSHDAKRVAAIRENTLSSLSEAASHAADLIEFDVQLSSDLIPVIYHDFTVFISLKKRNKRQQDHEELFKLPVKDLSLRQLQSLKLIHMSKKDADSEEHDTEFDILSAPFPTLAEVLNHVNKLTGFNIEIKYPQRFKDGVHEQDNFIERNQYADIILGVILKYAGNRRIIISCFDCDLCIMLRRKQNKYPVIHLFEGGCSYYPEFADRRAVEMDLAINFARKEHLLGLSVNAEVVLKNPSIVKRAKAEHLVVMTWGEEHNEIGNAERLRQLGVDAIIVDRICDFQNKGPNVFQLEQMKKSDSCESLTDGPTSSSFNSDDVVDSSLLLSSVWPPSLHH